MDFLNEQEVANGKKIYTSARNDGLGNPITDVNITKSDVKPFRQTKSINIFDNRLIDGNALSQWMEVKGYYYITVLSTEKVTGIELHWSTDGENVADKEQLIEITPITTSIASDFVRVKISTDTPTTLSNNIYLAT